MLHCSVFSTRSSKLHIQGSGGSTQRSHHVLACTVHLEPAVNDDENPAVMRMALSVIQMSCDVVPGPF